MADDLLKMRHHKLLFELKFLYADLNYHQSVMDTAATKFQLEFIDFCKEEKTYDALFPKRPSPPSKTPIETPKSNEIYELKKSNISKESKDLHKKIATMTHPDKLSKLSKTDKNHRSSLFRKAGECVEKDDLFALQQIALDLGIDLGEPTEEQLLIFESEATRIREKITGYTGTFAWVWHHQSDKEVRKKLFKQYQQILIDSIDKKEK